ncbi:MAG: M48 family metalloprotease [Magnetococcales bacterium]|nr:M48 family metalloprotease [Magnetococcales bacterium]MBF0322537.1 M48 family metalloprotease [Magnetococcales bacterium]
MTTRFHVSSVFFRRLLLSSLLSMAMALSHPDAAGSKEKDPDTVILISDPEITDLLDQLAAPLVQIARFPPESIRFHVILSDSLNAFALENNHIVFHSGLILAVHNRDELAGVMAHEMGHLVAGHHIKMQDEARNLSIRSLIAAAVGIAAGVVAHDSNIAEAAIAGGAASSHTSMLTSMRQKEQQSDRIAISFLSQAGYNPIGLAHFLERINREQRLASQPPPYLLTHPLSSARITEAKDSAAIYPPPNPRPDHGKSAWISRIQAKLAAGVGDDPGASAERLHKRMTLGDSAETIQAARYGLAMAQRYGGHLSDSEANLTTLLSESPKNPYFLRERGVTRLEMNRIDEAEKDFKAALLLLPNHFDLRYQLAVTLIERKQFEQASRILRQLTSERPLEPKPFYQLGLVEGEMQRLGASHLALARYHHLMTDSRNALWHYQEAVRLLPAQSQEQTIAQAEWDQLRHPKKR